MDMNICAGSCEYFSSCRGDAAVCVMRAFYEAFQRLSEEEALVLKAMYGFFDGEALSAEMTAEKYGFTQEEVISLENLALEDLRNSGRGRFLTNIGELILSVPDTPFGRLFKAAFGDCECDFGQDDTILVEEREELSLTDSVESCGFTIRVRTGLQRCGIETVGELVRLDPGTLLELCGFGSKQIAEVYLVLDYYGIRSEYCPAADFPSVTDWLCGELSLDPQKVEAESVRIAKRLLPYNTAKKIVEVLGIGTYKELSRITREELSGKYGFSDEELDYVRYELVSHGYFFSDEAVYFCTECGKVLFDEWDLNEERLCEDCSSWQLSDEDFEETLMNGNDFVGEICERWGNTDAYSEYIERSAGEKCGDMALAAAELDSVFAEFAECMRCGEGCGSYRAASLAKKLQDHITESFYTCTDDILKGLALMYVSDGRFKENIDRHGEGTAQYVFDSVNAYLERKLN